MSDGRSLDRRRFLASAGRSAVAAGATMTGLAWPTSRAHALGEPLVGAARLVIPGLDDPRPGALDDLMEEVRDNTSVQTVERAVEVAPDSQALFDQPFVVLLGDRAFDPLPDDAITTLRLYVREGGFLFVDDASGLRDSEFDASVRRDLARILPTVPACAPDAVLRFFGVPMCLLGEQWTCSNDLHWDPRVTVEWQSAPGKVAYTGIYSWAPNRKRAYAPQCASCRRRDVCMGVNDAYLLSWETDELRPFQG